MVLVLKGHLETSLDLLPTSDNRLGGKIISPRENSSCSTAACKHWCQTCRLAFCVKIYLAAVSEGAPVLPQPPQIQIHSPVPRAGVPIYLGDTGLEK